MSRAARLGLLLLLVVLLAYGWANRTGRYQVAGLSATGGVFVVLDKATGAHCVYLAKPTLDGGVHYEAVDGAAVVPLWQRLAGPCVPHCQ